MLESNLRRLLEEAVNTSLKLAIVMLYAEPKQRFSGTAVQISTRLCRDIWSVENALLELTEDGILAQVDGKFHYKPVPEWREALARLFTTYDEPLRRQEIMRVVSELDSYAPYREVFKDRIVTVFSM